MKALLLAATSSLALTGFAMAQTPAPDGAATTTTESTTIVEDAATDLDNAAAGAADQIEDGADSAESAVDETVTTGTADVVEDAADSAESAADEAVTAGSGDAAVTTTTDTTTTTTDTTTTDTMGTDAPGSDVTPAPMTPADGTTTTTTDMTTTDTTGAVVVAPDVDAPALSADNPGMLGSWLLNRRIWTTNQPSSTAWDDPVLTERPAEWTDIAKVGDIVVDADGNVLGYVADIGGFLGIGAKQVLLGKDALHFVRIGDDAFFATNFTREELEALPDFDKSTVMQ